MNNFRLISEGIDVAPLLAQLEAHPELWDQHTLRKRIPGGPHSRMSDIWVRYNDISRFPVPVDRTKFNSEHVPVWYPAWKALPALRPIVFDLMAKVQGEMLCAVLITRIPAGEGINPHVDAGWHVDYTEKFYLSVQNEPGARFCFEGESFEPKPGEIWMADNRRRHWVTNESEEDRITLIICVRTDLFGRY